MLIRKSESMQTATVQDNDYGSLIQTAKMSIEQRKIEDALAHLSRAIALGTARPEAFNLMGAAIELCGDVYEAQKYYRAALSFDPSYTPSQKNLSRTVSWRREGEIILDDNKKK
jgi:Flp pilus assembly protein TadD